MIKKIKLTNIRCIDNFEATFDGGVYLITGENEIGKSTLLESILMLTTGVRANNLLKRGRELGTAEMVAEIEGLEYTITVTFTPEHPRGMFTIATANSPLKSTNVTALQTIFNYTDFDLTEFVKWSETAEGRRKQLTVARALLPAPILAQVDALENTLVLLGKQKSDANVRRQHLNAALKNTQRFTPETVEKYAQPFDVQNAVDTLEKTRAYNAKLAQGQTELNRIAFDILEYETKIVELRARANIIEAAINGKKAKDTTALEQTIAQASEHNRMHTLVALYQQTTDQIMQAESDYAHVDTMAMEVTNQRAALIKANPIPVPGLEYGETGLLYNGMEVAPGALSTGQQIELAARLAMALNPKMRVFRVAQGESMGGERLRALVEFATQNGFQGFIEQVERGQQTMIVEHYEETANGGENVPVVAPKAKSKANPRVRQ